MLTKCNIRVLHPKLSLRPQNSFVSCQNTGPTKRVETSRAYSSVDEKSRLLGLRIAVSSSQNSVVQYSLTETTIPQLGFINGSSSTLRNVGNHVPAENGKSQNT
jgi:hypothetical protein